jgi:hypothetical protein
MPLIPTPSDTDFASRRLAVLAESLYLANLLIAPGLGFIGLLWLWRRAHTQSLPLARQHLRQTLVASLWAGALLIGLSALILLIGGLASMWSWVALILYFTFFHSALVLCGMVGLARALAGQPFRFPLIGPGEPR